MSFDTKYEYDNNCGLVYQLHNGCPTKVRFVLQSYKVANVRDEREKKNAAEVRNKRDNYIGCEHSIPFYGFDEDNWHSGMGVAKGGESREGVRISNELL